MLGRPRPLGERGERHAAKLLKRKGFKMLLAGRRNRYGEFDLVALDRRRERSLERQPLVFVEVKTRRSLRAGTPAEAVTPEKQRRLSRAALAFLRSHDLLEHPVRFDVVAIHWPKGERLPLSAEHFVNAFEPPASRGFFG
ncbi:hypothetical protein Mal64_19000 [Pseudobythopirellula maris]|uniref:UPF0102 protein Mal64_19000 n=2 Tax=Pseudobythopirellula maris TaxID=2527991 RepID=A0A5C5ZLZ5_9BACT|nr:hypothetical protein Mal64_19000 [Pseudobythopirellula maris]